MTHETLSNKAQSKSGYTLVEIMITLAIVAIVLSLGITTLAGYLPKQRLNISAQNLSAALEKARIQAAKGQPVCIKFPSTINQSGAAHGKIEMYAFPNDDESAMGTSGSCATTTAGIVKFSEPIVFKEDVDLSTCTGTVSPGCVIWILKDGTPTVCAGDATPCGLGSPASGCAAGGVSFEIILTSTGLDSGVKAREVELLDTGLVSNPKPGEKGYNDSHWAKNPDDAPSAAGACE